MKRAPARIPLLTDQVLKNYLGISDYSTKKRCRQTFVDWIGNPLQHRVQFRTDYKLCLCQDSARGGGISTREKVFATSKYS